MSKVGRNDPCPCQSGKKYKKCCYQTQEAELKKEASLYHASNVLRELDVEERKGDLAEMLKNNSHMSDILSQFDLNQGSKTYSETVSDLKTLLASDSPDTDDIYEVFDNLFILGENDSHFDYYLSVLPLFKEKNPAAYQENERYFLQNSIESLLILGRYEAINELLGSYVRSTEADIDCVSKMVDLLVLYGQDETAITLLRLAWPAISHSEDIFSWAKERFKTDYYQLLTIQQLVDELNGASIFDAEKFLLIDEQQEEDRSIYTAMRKRLLESSSFDASSLEKNGELFTDPAVNDPVMNAFIRFVMKKYPNNVCKPYAYWKELATYFDFLINNQTIKKLKKPKNWNIIYPRNKMVDCFISYQYTDILFPSNIQGIIMFLESLNYWIQFLVETNMLKDMRSVCDSLSSTYQMYDDELKSGQSHPLYRAHLQKLHDIWAGSPVAA